MSAFSSRQKKNPKKQTDMKTEQKIRLLQDWTNKPVGFFKLENANRPATVVLISSQGCPPCIRWAGELEKYAGLYPKVMFGKFYASHRELLGHLQEIDYNNPDEKSEPLFEAELFPTIVLLKCGKFVAEYDTTGKQRLGEWLAKQGIKP